MRKAFHCSGNLLTSGQETTCKKGYTDGLPSINHQLKADTATVPSSSPLPSPNFQFLGRKNTMLISIAGYAESYVFTDPNAAMFKLRQFAELIARKTANEVGISTDTETRLLDLINDLQSRGYLTPEIRQVFHTLRKSGNVAAHEFHGDRREALSLLKFARRLAIWFHKTFNNKHFKAPQFIPPQDPADAESDLASELEASRKKYAETQAKIKSLEETAEFEAELRKEAEVNAAKAYADLAAAIELTQEDSQRVNETIVQYEAQLSQETVKAPSDEKLKQIVEASIEASADLLDEAETRDLIDRQLREEGWEADTQTLRHSAGVRPQKGKNLAIAEWPTETGPADYVLFKGLTPLAIVEAKKESVDVASAIEQSKRYSRGFQLDGDLKDPGGPWNDYKIPFLFSTNGRPYIRQLKTKSGVWFLDARRPTNHSRPLESWYTPTGLHDLLKQDIAEAEKRLQTESSDYLPLRDYQQACVKAVEKGIVEGRREMLVAMATGTGKTRTAIGIMYRLIKAKRFRRILFLVDRSALGEQAADSFKDVKLENFQSFSDIYDVKELGDMVPDEDTRLHVATIQGMVQRLFYPSNESQPLPVDQYDCILIDECHRGYNLDREMSDSEIQFRSESDYISKYTRVLDHFDAVKIGLTATPALHTTGIFGGPEQSPIYQYSYRQAVIDGYLVDHEPPTRITTALAQSGIKWNKGEEITVFDTGKGQLQLFTTPDEVSVEIEEFNRKVVTENFNRVVCKELVKHIDPSLPGKTMVFCATDTHADLVVQILKEEFTELYGEINEDAVKKITGKSDKPKRLIRRLKNEQLPKIAVTVDLLTTGIDVPAITNIVFLRRVRSRILYEQMLGRGTRLCPDLYGDGLDKDRFYIFDAVDLYSNLQEYTEMKPVVAKVNLKFEQLVTELNTLKDPEHLEIAKSQIIAKLQTKKRTLRDKKLEKFEELTQSTPDEFIEQLKPASPKEVAGIFQNLTGIIGLLDKNEKSASQLLVSEHEDELVSVERGYGQGRKPQDYLESFREYIEQNRDEITALQVVCQRPRDLTREQLRQLKIELDNQGYSETRLRSAIRETTNQDFASTIIGYIRHVALGMPLMPYEDRVKSAMEKIMTSRSWTAPQRQWLERIGKQLEKETIVDRDAFEHGRFKDQGGFTRLNKVFDGQLDALLGEISDAIWSIAA